MISSSSSSDDTDTTCNAGDSSCGLNAAEQLLRAVTLVKDPDGS